MRDLDELREALHDRSGRRPPTPDIHHILNAGGRLRQRRRVRVGLISAAAVSLLLAGGTVVGHAGQEPRIEIATTPAPEPTPSLTPTSTPPTPQISPPVSADSSSPTSQPTAPTATISATSTR